MIVFVYETIYYNVKHLLQLCLYMKLYILVLGIYYVHICI